MTEPTPARAVTVLVVEDEDLILALLGHGLRAQGYQVLSARTAEEGLGLLRRHGADLVITDLNMPGMGGIELIKQVRADPVLGHTPILAMTGNITLPLQLAGPAGANATLLKPFQLGHVLQEVERLLGGRAGP